MQRLNNKQLNFVYNIIHHIKITTEPIYRFLSGGAGVGKSFVTTALYQTALKYLNKKEGDDYSARKVLLLAPTGKAAYHIKGTTIHSGLKIAPNQKLEHHTLSCSALNTLRNEIGSLKLIFIDEISMVGFKMLNCINQRLKEVKQSPKPFGGISIIAVGDLFQLKPVMDSYIFRTPGNGYLPLATNLWQELFYMFELTEIMRQADNKPFAELLNRLREGNHTSEDIRCLQKRQLQMEPSAPDYPYQSVHLYSTNDKVNAFNSMVINKADAPKAIIIARDRFVGSAPQVMREKILANFKNNKQNKQLSNVVEIAKGLVYDLTVNIDTSDGLINGASYLVMKLGLPVGETGPKGVIWVKFFDGHIGAALRNWSKRLYQRNIEKTWTPIEPLVKQFSAGHKGQALIQRLQFPLRQAHAKTIHRSQGDTMDDAVIDLTSTRKIDHIHYVAISRLRTLQGLHLLNLQDDKISVSTDVQQEMAGLRSNPIHCCTPSLAEQPGNLTIVFLNARSLHRHLPDVKADTRFANASILIFSEARFCSRDTEDFIALPKFRVQCRHDSTGADNSRPYYVLCLYTNRLPLFSHKVGNEKIEILVSKLEEDMFVCAVYKAPSASTKVLCRLLEEAHRKFAVSKCVILGDFNVDWNVNNAQKKCLEDILCARLGYTQITTGPTTDQNTTIDLMFSRVSAPVHGDTCEVYFSDHKMIRMSITSEMALDNCPPSTSSN